MIGVSHIGRRCILSMLNSRGWFLWLFRIPQSFQSILPTPPLFFLGSFVLNDPVSRKRNKFKKKSFVTSSSIGSFLNYGLFFGMGLDQVFLSINLLCCRSSILTAILIIFFNDSGLSIAIIASLTLFFNFS